MIIVLCIMYLLVVGIRESARFNAVMVGIKLAAVLFFIGAGVVYVRPENWIPSRPYGWSGVMGAAGVVFFAYIGFDAVSTTAEEAKNPQRDLPIGIIASLVVCTVLYLAVAAILTGIVPVVDYKADQDFLNAPVAFALSLIGQDWAAYLVSAGAVAGITSVLLVMLMSQPRIFFAMSRDGLLPQGVSKVHPRYGTPYITTIITCVIVAIVAGLTQIQTVGEMTSIGTLFAFAIVCGAVLILRVKRPEVHRPFRVPVGPVFPVLGIASCVYLMLSLPILTWVRFLVWLDLGMIIYWFYGRTHSPLVNAKEAAGRSAFQNLANFVYVMGVLAVFNFACIARARLHDRNGLDHRDHRQVARDRRDRRRGRRLRPQVAGGRDRRLAGRLRAAQGVGREVGGRCRWRGERPVGRDAPRRGMSARRLDGAAASPRRSAPSWCPDRRVRRGAGRPPGWARPGRRRSGVGDLRPEQAAHRGRGRLSGRTGAAGGDRHPRRRAGGVDRLNRRRGDRRHPGPVAAAAGHGRRGRTAGLRRHPSRQGRRRIPSAQRRPAGPEAGPAGGVYAVAA